MRTRFALVLALMGFFFAASSARAGIDWTYVGDKEVKISSGGSDVFFHGTTGSAANSTGIVIYNLTASSTTGNDDPPDHFGGKEFILNVSIIDELARTSKTGNEIGTVTFKGFFTADVTKGSITDWGVTWEVDKGEVTLGNATVGKRKYEIEIDGFLPPSPNNPTVNGQGVVHAFVKASNVIQVDDEPVDDPETEEPSQTPEPASLLLAGFGVSGLLVWRRRRQRA